METWNIKGYTVEYLDDEHIYLIDGVVVPSITQILKIKFGDKYNNVSKKVLDEASRKGTEVHKAIELFCKERTESKLKEVRNFKFLQKKYGFNVEENEVPIILFKDDEPIACGRLDLVLSKSDSYMLGDIKRVATLDKNYLAYQLNLYRIGYQQCYNTKIDGLKGLHLREDKRRFVDIPVNEQIAWDLIDEYLEMEKENEF